MEKVDIIGRINGDFGKWQLRAVLLIYLCKIPSAWFMACIIFTAPEPRNGEYFCTPQTVLNVNTEEHFQQMLDINKTGLLRAMHPITDDRDNNNAQDDVLDYCNVYANSAKMLQHYMHETTSYYTSNYHSPPKPNNSLVPCEDFSHHSEYESLITVFDLVCDKSILVATTQFFHLFGVLTGGLLATYLLKHFSPKSVMLFGMISQIFCGSLTGLDFFYGLHVFFRCLSAICCCQMYTAGGMIFSDITGGKPKTIVVTLFEQFWSIGVICLPFIASFFKSWTHIYLAISWPTLILIVLWRWIPNSPRWLLAHGYYDEARDVLKESAQFNDRNHLVPQDLDYLLLQQAQNMQNDPPPAGFWTLFKGPKATRHMICVHICWSIYIVVYYGMLLNIRVFSREHLELNTMIAGLCEIIGVFCGLCLILFTTRKWLWTGLFNILAGLIAYCGWLVPPESNIDIDIRVALLMLSAMISKTAISCTLAILTTCTTELVCAEKKKMCTFSTIVYARIWLLCAPYIGATSELHKLYPQTTLASLAIIGGILSTLISSPRTIQPPVKHSNLPKELQLGIYTIKDVDSIPAGGIYKTIPI